MTGLRPRRRVRLFTGAVAAVGAALFWFSGVHGIAMADLPLAAPEEAGMSSERLERVTATMQRYIDNNQLAGTVTLIARHGKVVHFEAQGWRDKEANAPMTRDTIFAIMSMTKPIVSTALMMLFEEGRFLLDDPISKWLPGYGDRDVAVREPARTRREPAARPVTIRHVLTHTSGLILAPDFSPDYSFPVGPIDIERPRTVEDAVKRAADRPLAFHPGDEWQYGASTDYVALLVEKISGMSTRDFLEARLFGPLDMDDSFYTVPESKVARQASVYRRGPNGNIALLLAPRRQDATQYFGGVAGLHSTAADYFQFHQMMLNGGELNGVRILSPRTINLMISNHTGDKDIYVAGPGYGFGLGYGIVLDPGKANEHLSPGSFFWSGALNTLAWVDPVEDMLAILMTQLTPYGSLSVMRDIATVASQAIVETNRHNPPTVMGYEARR